MIWQAVIIAVASQRQCVIAQEIQAVTRFDDHRNHLGERLVLQFISIREKKFGLPLAMIIIVVARGTIIYGVSHNPGLIIQGSAHCSDLSILQTVKIIQIVGYSRIYNLIFPEPVIIKSHRLQIFLSRMDQSAAEIGFLIFGHKRPLACIQIKQVKSCRVSPSAVHEICHIIRLVKTDKACTHCVFFFYSQKVLPGTIIHQLEDIDASV